jgi:hypothetical protein
MRLLLITALIASGLWGYSLNKFYEDYKKKNYYAACKHGVSIFAQNKKSNEFLTVYSFACLKSDMIDRLAVPVTGLRGSKEARSNASYFASILLQKKLLYNAVIDGIDISGLNLPTSDYILSKVFHMYADKEYEKSQNRYIMEDGRLVYEMYVKQEGGYKKLVIEQYKDSKLIQTHKYF